MTRPSVERHLLHGRERPPAQRPRGARAATPAQSKREAWHPGPPVELHDCLLDELALVPLSDVVDEPLMIVAVEGMVRR